MWTDYTEEELRFSLVTCVLSSRVPYEVALAAAARLREAGLLLMCSSDSLIELERRLGEELSRPIPLQQTGGYQRYRFPFLRAKCLRQTFERIYFNGGSLSQLIASYDDSLTLRAKLVSVVTGMGPKQASLFLRNIGFASDLAILDSHVLRFMRWRGLLVGSSVNVSALRTYEKVERALYCYAANLGCALSHLDVAIWITMRVLNRGLSRELGYVGLRRLGLDAHGLSGERGGYRAISAFR